jgi:phosphate transport system permease protein
MATLVFALTTAGLVILIVIQMAVTMVIGNRPEISSSLFDPSFTIASAIANEFTEATSEIYRHALVELGLILFVITFAINAAARLLVWSVTRGQGRAAHA